MWRFASRTAWDRAPSAFARIAGAARAAPAGLIDLTESNPTRVGLGPGPELLAELGHPRGARYVPEALGERSARVAVAGYYAERRIAVDPDRVVLSASSSEAYAWLFRLLCEPGDDVLVPAPSYPLFGFLAELSDVALRAYPLIEEEGFRPDLAAIEALIGPRTRSLVVVHPNNPTGTMVSVDDALALDSLLAGRGVSLVTDEVFGDYVDAGARVARLSSFAGPRETLTFVLSGLSKVLLAPQLKLGWTVVCGPDDAALEAIGRLEVIADTFLSVGTPVQRALPALLAARAAIQAPLKGRLTSNLASLDASLAAFEDAQIVRRMQRDGGWYAVLEVPRTRTEDEWVARLAEEDGILVHPGHFFEMPRSGTLVVSLLLEPEVFARATSRLVARLHQC